MIDLIRQHVPKVGPCAMGNSCVYQRSDGKRCAAGAFLPDGHPTLTAGEATIGTVMERWPKLDLPLNSDGMGQLQEAHDHASAYEAMHPLLIAWIYTNTTETQ
jgi:hypothetical protein